MKKITFLLLLLNFLNATAQIGDGWDWAFNTEELEVLILQEHPHHFFTEVPSPIH